MESFFGDMQPIGFLAVLASAVVMMAVGTAWYSARLFGKGWSRHTGIRPNDIRREEKRRGYIVEAIAALVMAYLLGLVAAHSGGSAKAIMFSVAFIWLFVMIEQLQGFLWERDPFALFLLEAFRSLFALLAGGLIFLLWS